MCVEYIYFITGRWNNLRIRYNVMINESNLELGTMSTCYLIVTAWLMTSASGIKWVFFQKPWVEPDQASSREAATQLTSYFIMD